MSVKILGGMARGYPLSTPRSESTRPTSVMIRRKLFDWRQNLEGHVFIDVCAGSGAMGFEALSRGADRIHLNDSQKGAVLTLKDNQRKFTEAFKVDPSRVSVTGVDALTWILKELGYQVPDTSEAILFLDPPYADHALYFKIMAALKERDYRGELWVEGDRLSGPAQPEIIGAFQTVSKTMEQGDHFVVTGHLL